MVCFHKHFVWATCRWKNDILLNVMYKLLLLVTCARLSFTTASAISQCVRARECIYIFFVQQLFSHCFLNNDLKATEMKRSQCILLHRYRVCAMCTTSERTRWGSGWGWVGGGVWEGEHQCSFFVCTSANM